MSKHKVLVIATSRKTRGGITSVIKAHEQGINWKNYSIKWIASVRDANAIIKIIYFIRAFIQFLFLLPGAKLLHIHAALGNSIKRKNYFITIGKLLRKKVIIHFHAADKSLLDDKENIKTYRKIFLKADQIIVLSDSWKHLLVQRLNLDPNKVSIVYNPSPKVERTLVKEKIILFAGTLIKRKGYDILLKAFARIIGREEVKDWKLILAGNGELDEARNLIRELDLQNNVELVGWVSGEEKTKLFQAAAIFCLPSQAEGFPMAILDAWAYGIPCIVTPVGGIPDLISPEQEGLIVPVNDIEKLSKALYRLIQSQALREQIVDNTDKKIREDFDLSVIDIKISQIYQRLLNTGI